MKLTKKITMNEAVMQVVDNVQPYAGIVLADAINQSAKNRERIEKVFAEKKVSMPNEDRFAHKKVDATKEMKKMKLAESLFTEWFDDDKEKETFVQPNIILEESQYQFDDETGNIIVNKAIFDDYMEGKKLNVKFVDEEGEDIFCYKMISENDDSITMEYVGEGIPGIDEELCDCQKYPIKKPEAKDSTFVSAKDKQPKDMVKSKDSGFVSAGDKQPNKAAMKESKLSNWDKLQTVFPQLDRNRNQNNQTTTLSVDDIIDKLQNTTDKDLLKKISDLLAADDAEDSAKDVVVVNSDTINQNQSKENNRQKLVKAFPNLNMKESFTNWNSPESRIERYETDLPELMATMHDLYMDGKVEAEDYAEALKVAYDALDSVPHMDEALEDSQRYPIEKPKAKDSTFVSAKDKQVKVDAKDSQFVSAGDKNVEKAFSDRKLGENLKKKLTEEVVYKYKPTREPLGEIIQLELTEGEWGYREEDGKQTATRLPSANYMEQNIGASWDIDDKYAITVIAPDAESLDAAIKIAVKYNKEYKIEKLTRPISGNTVKLWIYVDEEKDFDEPYKGDSIIVDMEKVPVNVRKQSDEPVAESIEPEQKFPIESPIAEELEADKLEEANVTTIGLANFIPEEAAQAAWNKIMDAGKIGVFEFMISDMFPNGPTAKDINDLLINDSEWLFNMLHIDDSEISATDSLDFED